MNYRSLNDLAIDVAAGLHRVPRDVDLVVGVPRSGMLPATLLSVWLGKPLADVDGLLSGCICSVGRTRARYTDPIGVEDVRHVLLVEDSVDTGTQLQSALRRLVSARSFRVTTACAYAKSDSEHLVDIAFAVCDVPRAFEWNIMHSIHLQTACVDIDGVLCRDPTPAENDDGTRYRQFLETSEPKFLPTVPIGVVVSSRLERYRKLTEAWLKRWNIAHERLVLLDLPDKKTRQRRNCHGAFKGRVYRELSQARLFVESSAAQAPEIADVACKQVYCVETGRMVYPHVRRVVSRSAARLPGVVARRSGLIDTSLGKWLLQFAARR